MEGKTVLRASVSGTVTPKDEKDPETYKITVVYDDGSKSVLKKKYEEFVDLQVKVYELLKLKGGYSRKTSRTLISSLPENNSALSRILFKDSDLKKMARMDEFIKELLTLPALVRKSDVVLTFFGALNGENGVIEKSSEEEQLKKVTKVAEMLSGRDPLRDIPQQSPLLKRKTKYSSTWIPEDLHVLSEEARDHLYLKLNRLNERRPSKEIPTLPDKPRTTSVTDDVLDKKVAPQRPGLRRRPFSVAVGLADLGEQTRKMLNEKKPEQELSHQQSESDGDESHSAQGESSAIDSEYSEVEETRSRKISIPSSARNSLARTTLNRAKHVVISSFFAEESGEVSLEEGDEVDVLQKEPSGWWYVKNDFSEGWAPSAFLVPATSRSPSPETPDEQQVSDSQGESCQIRETLETCPKEEVNKTKKFVPPKKEKIQDRNVVTGSQTIATEIEMNRRPKFLTVEGIQKRKNPDKNYVYILKVVWSDGNINIIYRTCSDFFFLQENLRKEFPTAIGKEIPALKGRKFSENCQFCFKDGKCKRQKFMNQFCQELINAPENISKSKVVMDFCRSRASDVHPHGESAKKDGKISENDDDDGDNVQISGPVVFEQYVVTADYQKKNKNDISLTAGDLVDVIERNDYGWWLVDKEGELGWAPASHLEPSDDGSEITTSKVFAPGKEEIYISIKSYQAKADDELSFDADVMLKVVEKTLDGWWLVRYQGDEGWAPAMFLKRVDSDESSTSTSRKMDTLDIVSFNGDSEDGDSNGFSRTPPTRRSMVQRTVRRKPKRNSIELNGISEGENGESKTSGVPVTKNSRSISVPAPVYTPPINRKTSPRSKGLSSPRSSPRRPRSSEFSQGELESSSQSRQFSISSSGYESSPNGSLSSLVSPDVFVEEQSTNGIKKCATLPRFDNIEDGMPVSSPSLGIPRSKSVTSMEHFKNEMELSLNGISSTGRKSSSGRSSPISSKRKISTPRRSPLAGSPPKGRDFGSISPSKMSPRESSSELENEENIATSRLYRAIHTYISQDSGEVTFNEGDEVEVVQKSENGWWLLRTSEELGWGPSNFLQSLIY